MKNIRMQTAVSLAEIITALAVVVSLLYAANEFKRSRQLSSTDVESTLYTRMLEMDRLLIEGEGMADILTAAEADPAGLTDSERLRLTAYEHIFYDTWELAWAANDDGVMDDAAWMDWNAWFIEEARRRADLGWEANRKNYGPEFIEFVDGLLAEDRSSN